MADEVRVKNIGLRGVTVADSKISYIDGAQGVLIYRGFRIEELAGRSSFMETSYLLLNGRLPTGEELSEFSADVAQKRTVPDYVLSSMRAWPKDAPPMDVLQSSVPLLAMDDPKPVSTDRRAVEGKARALIAKMPTLGWRPGSVSATGRTPLPRTGT